MVLTRNEVDELPAEDLLSSSIVQPMELVALVSMNLLQGSTGTYSSISNTYSDYLKGLVSLLIHPNLLSDTSQP